jgi:hypothetical protein
MAARWNAMGERCEVALRRARVVGFGVGVANVGVKAEARVHAREEAGEAKKSAP